MVEVSAMAASDPTTRSVRARAGRRRLAVVLGTLACGAALSACSIHEHTVGLGPTGVGTETARQYFFLFGLFRLNEVDTESLAEESTSYRIRTESAFTDFLLAPLLLPLTVTTRTVTVER
ncbi:MAG: hypothetical protein IPM29_31980 [Planctomycetes bacterium]|nr:hypothetical protein [Planctomycetota bacterium]